MKNREILFKGKRVDNNEWVKGKSLIQGIIEGREFAQIEHSDFDNYRQYDVHTDTVCQFVKDDLFEGDVLRSINHYEGGNPYYNYHIIQWSEKFNGWYANNKDNLGQEDTNGDIQLWIYLKNTEFEKIGNIHD